MSPGQKVFIIITLSAAALSLLIACFRTGKPLRSIVLNVLCGVGALYAINGIGLVSHLHIAVNSFSLATACVAGIPGVLTLVALQNIFR